MGKLTEDVAELFAESCCGGAPTSDDPMSCQPCGCDPGAGWVCERHRELHRQDTARYGEVSLGSLTPPTNTAPPAVSQELTRPTNPRTKIHIDDPGALIGPGTTCPTAVLHVKAGSAEVCVTDPITGGQKGSKLQRFSLIPSEFLWALAQHYGIGSQKYSSRNWERGYAWHLSQDAHDRHLHRWLQGERHDPETGTHHLVCAAWHLIALFIYDLHELGTDDITSARKSE